MLRLLLIGLLTASPALAQEAPRVPTAAASAAASAAQVRLEEAKALYFAGGHARALAALAALAETLAPDDPEQREVLVEVDVYRAEIEYVTNDRAASWASFARVLGHSPEYRINTFLHPAEVVDWFDLVRREVSAQQVIDVPPPAPIARAPAWTLAPLGIPQLRQGRTASGLVYGGGQVAALGASVGLHLALRDWKRDLATAPDDDPGYTRFNRVRYGAQIPATALFYGLYVVSVIDGRRSWSTTKRVRPMVWIHPTDPQLGVAFQF